MENSNKREVHFNTSKNIIHQFNNNKPVITLLNNNQFNSNEPLKPLNNNQFNNNKPFKIVIDNFIKDLTDDINIRKICVDKINDKLKYIDKEIIKKLNISSLPPEIINLGDKISFKDKLIIRQNFINEFIHNKLNEIFSSIINTNNNNNNKLINIDDKIIKELNLNLRYDDKLINPKIYGPINDNIFIEQLNLRENDIKKYMGNFISRNLNYEAIFRGTEPNIIRSEVEELIKDTIKPIFPLLNQYKIDKLNKIDNSIKSIFDLNDEVYTQILSNIINYSLNRKKSLQRYINKMDSINNSLKKICNQKKQNEIKNKIQEINNKIQKLFKENPTSKNYNNIINECNDIINEKMSFVIDKLYLGENNNKDIDKFSNIFYNNNDREKLDEYKENKNKYYNTIKTIIKKDIINELLKKNIEVEYKEISISPNENDIFQEIFTELCPPSLNTHNFEEEIKYILIKNKRQKFNNIFDNYRYIIENDIEKIVIKEIFKDNNIDNIKETLIIYLKYIKKENEISDIISIDNLDDNKIKIIINKIKDYLTEIEKNKYIDYIFKNNNIYDIYNNMEKFLIKFRKIKKKENKFRKK